MLEYGHYTQQNRCLHNPETFNSTKQWYCYNTINKAWVVSKLYLLIV